MFGGRCIIMSYLVILYGMVSVSQLADGEPLFQTYEDELIPSTNHGIIAARAVTSINQCKTYCLQAKEEECLGANLIPMRLGVYSCELINFVMCTHIGQKGGVSIRKTGKCFHHLHY